MADNKSKNPWKGLNFYVEGEILYGRNAEILSLSQYIFNNTQTVLYGRSGIGKSSILNAGIFPRARQNGMIPVSIRLKHSEVNDYLAQIKEALDGGGIDVKELVPAIREDGSETLWEFMHRHIFIDRGTGEQTAPLLVLDQFEEIFTLQTDEPIRRDFFKQLGDLLNDVKPSYIAEQESLLRQQQSQQQETKMVSTGAFKGLNIKLNVRKSDDQEDRAKYVERPDYHIVFALREDFLSSLELYAASIPVMKDNRFGLLPINEEQAAEIIQKPQPGLVDDDVTKLIIEQVTGRTDFTLDGIPEIEVDAAVLSLFLSRLYIKKPADEPCITQELVKTSSGHIIYDFYVESTSSDPEKYEIISPQSIEILEDKLLTGEGRRNNVSRSDLIALGITPRELSILTNKRKLLRQFHHGNDIRVEYIHDILCPVVKARKMQREQLRLQEIEHEKQVQEKQRIIELAEARTLHIKRRNRKIIGGLLGFGTLIGVAVLICLYVLVYLPNKEYVEYYAEFELVNGWPKGIKKLSLEERNKSPLYYRLSHIGGGKSANHTDVEVMSSNTMLPSTPRIKNWAEECTDDNDVEGAAFNDILSKVHKLHFIPTEDGKRVAQMEFKDARDSLMMSTSYVYLSDRDGWLYYKAPNGREMQIRDNRIDRIKMSWDSIGRIECQRYCDSNGAAKPINGKNGIAGFYYKYPSENQKECYNLNLYGVPNMEASYNVERKTTKNDTTITEYFKVKSLDDKYLEEARGDNGYSRIVAIGNEERLYIPKIENEIARCITETDHNGNPTRQTITGSVNDSLPPVIVWKYHGKTGLLTQKKYLTSDSKPFGRKKNDIYRWENIYDSDGNITSERHYNTADKILYSHIKTTKIEGNDTIKRDVLRDFSSKKYLTTIDTITPNKITTAFFDDSGKRINQKVLFWANDSVLCHRRVVTTKGKEKVFRHYIVDNNGVVAPLETSINDDTGRKTSFQITKIFDNDGNVTNMEIKDAKGNILTRMMYFIQNGEAIARAVWGVDDNPVRCPDWEEEGLTYYKTYFCKDYNKSYVFLQPYDEWMHNSVLLMDDDYYKILYLDMWGWLYVRALDNNLNKGYNEVLTSIDKHHPIIVPAFKEDEKITDVEFPYLHILSKNSILFKNGLRDGNRIIQLGSWRVGDSKDKLKAEWSKVQKGQEMTITVLPTTKTGYGKKLDIKIKNDPNVGINAEYHFVKLSKEEKVFYEQINE